MELVFVVEDDCDCNTAAMSAVVGGPTWRDIAPSSSNPFIMADMVVLGPTAPMLVAFWRREVAERKCAVDMAPVSDDVKGRLVFSKPLEWLVKSGGGWKKGGGEKWGFSVLMCMSGLGLGF